MGSSIARFRNIGALVIVGLMCCRQSLGASPTCHEYGGTGPSGHTWTCDEYGSDPGICTLDSGDCDNLCPHGVWDFRECEQIPFEWVDACYCAGSYDSLHHGGELGVWDHIESANQRFRLQYQDDGNLVLLDTDPEEWVVLWASDTNGESAGFVAMQGDGNFVIYDGDHLPVWASNTSGYYYLILQDDGDLAIKDVSDGVIWHTDTAQSPRPHHFD